jgi:3-deoxy-D-arabino-heptulosonate 7-phosphate (DAHP) synthase
MAAAFTAMYKRVGLEFANGWPATAAHGAAENMGLLRAAAWAPKKGNAAFLRRGAHKLRIFYCSFRGPDAGRVKTPKPTGRESGQKIAAAAMDAKNDEAVCQRADMLQAGETQSFNAADFAAPIRKASMAAALRKEFDPNRWQRR